MNPYTHYFLASQLESTFKPDHPGEYYLGAIIPDIRYLAGIRRDQTHISQTQIRKYLARYPNLESFLLGYQVHCVLDEIDITKIIPSAFPLNLSNRLFHKKFSQQQLTVLAELYFLQHTHTDWKVDENHNAVLTDLGIHPPQTEIFLNAMKEYLPAPSFETGLACFRKIGLVESSRFEKSLKAYQSLEKNKLLQAILWLSLKNAKLEPYAINYVQQRMKGAHLP